jgi:hypothetical protein
LRSKLILVNFWFSDAIPFNCRGSDDGEDEDEDDDDSTNAGYDTVDGFKTNSNSVAGIRLVTSDTVTETRPYFGKHKFELLDEYIIQFIFKKK